MALGARCATLALAAALLCGSEPGAGSSPTAADPIPCEAVTNQTDCGDRCKPLPAGSRKPRKFEVTGYHTCGYDGANGSEWRQYDWSKLTVVAEFCGRQDASFWGLLCAAHTHGAQTPGGREKEDAEETCCCTGARARAGRREEGVDQTRGEE